MTRKFEVITNFQSKTLYLLILFLGESLSKTSSKVKHSLHIFSLILSLLPIYTVIIVLRMLHCNAYLFPIKPGVL